MSELPLCCVLNGTPCDSKGGSYSEGCCGFQLCGPCTEKYREQASEIYQNTKCNYIGDMHHQFNSTCEHIKDREMYKKIIGSDS